MAVDFGESFFAFTQERVAQAIERARYLGQTREWRDARPEGAHLVLRVGPNAATYYRRGRDAKTGTVVCQRIGPAHGTGAITLAAATLELAELKHGGEAPAKRLMGRHARRAATQKVGLTIKEAFTQYIAAASTGAFSMRGEREPLRKKTQEGYWSIYRQHLAPESANDVGWLVTNAVEKFQTLGAGIISPDGNRIPGRPSLAQNYKAVVKALFEYLIEIGRFQGANPVEGRRWRSFKVARRETNLSAEAAARLLLQLEKEPEVWRHLFTTIILTGRRLGSIVNLRWDQVNLRQRVIYFVGSVEKTKKGGAAPMAEDVYQILKARHAVKTSDWVFESPWNAGRPVNDSAASHHWAMVAKAAGVKAVCHGNRHNFVSWAGEAGVGAIAIGAATGQQDLRTIQRYLHGETAVMAAPAVEAVARRLDAAKEVARKMTKNATKKENK